MVHILLCSPLLLSTMNEKGCLARFMIGRFVFVWLLVSLVVWERNGTFFYKGDGEEEGLREFALALLL